MRSYKVSSWQHLNCHFGRGIGANVQRFDNHAEGSMTKFCYLQLSSGDSSMQLLHESLAEVPVSLGAPARNVEVRW